MEKDNQIYDLGQYNDAELDNYVSSTPTAFNMGIKKDDSLGKWEIDFNTIVQNKIMAYRGYFYDNKNKTYVRNPHAVPMLNERGICDILNFYETHLNKIIPIGKFSRDEINTIMIRVRLAAGDLLYTNFELYEIPNYAAWRTILHDISTLALAVLNRSEDGWEATNRIKQISITQSHAQQNIQNQTAKKRGFLSGFFGGGN